MCSIKLCIVAAVLTIAAGYPDHGHGGGHDGGFGGHGGFGAGHGGLGHGGHGFGLGHGGHGGGHGAHGGFGGHEVGHGGHEGGHEGGHVSAHGVGHGVGHGAGHGAGHGGHGGDHIDYYAPPHYQFEYKVHDPHTGDVKSQQEAREGDKVKGFYTLKEADGTLREVHYEADHKNGFNAVVKRTGHATHPAVYGHHEDGGHGHGGGHGHH